MTSLLGRSLGFTGPATFQRAETDRRARALDAAPWLRFDGSSPGEPSGSIDTDDAELSTSRLPLAHPAGVNCLAIEGFRSRYLLSGGADASISVWDLDAPIEAEGDTTYRPLASISKSSEGHKFGITHLSFYPIDPGAFISSSYDKTLQVWDTNTLQSAISFPVPGQVYDHHVSPIATHLLVAVAVQDAFVRLIDLDSGASTHTLPGHEGAVLGVSWSPVREHILLSAGADGTVRLWDIRSAGNVLGCLDYEDSAGVFASGGATRDIASNKRGRSTKAHIGPCNGAVFSADGMHIVSCGHDERIRVWDASTGANTLVHFGPTIRNRVLASIKPTIVPPELMYHGQEAFMFPNGPDILMLDMHEGTLLRRLRPVQGMAARAKGDKGLKQRTTDICWRKGHCEAYSAHSSGLIKAWTAQPPDEKDAGQRDQEEEDERQRATDELGEEGERKRKRQELDQLHRDLTKQKITFT